jgi:ribonuclease Z
MRPLLHPSLVNGRFGDPAVYLETLFDRRALLFDLGDISALPPRKILRIEQIFVSHAHVDHFYGFDLLLRLLVGRAGTLQLYGPPGFLERVHHKLQAYHWNLIDEFEADLIFVVTELGGSEAARRAQFRLKNGFAWEDSELPPRSERGIIHADPMFEVSYAVLDHRIPCIGYAIQEVAHVNIWKNNLDARGLPVGPWLRDLKQAVLAGWPDHAPIEVTPPCGEDGGLVLPLGELRGILTVTSGQKIAYVTDVADTPSNRRAIIELARDADILFIESAFAAADSALSAERAHLTTHAAGSMAREAGVKRVEPFHFSSRYEGQGEAMIAEVLAAFEGKRGGRSDPYKTGS